MKHLIKNRCRLCNQRANTQCYGCKNWFCAGCWMQHGLTCQEIAKIMEERRQAKNAK